MRARWLFLGIAVVAIFAVGTWWQAKHPQGGLELAQAPVWSELQRIEVQHRSDKNLATPLLLKGAVNSGSYDLVGLRSSSQEFPYVWIVLNQSAGENGIYAIPQDVEFVLTCRDVARLSSETSLNSVVESVLRSNCRD